MTPVAVPLSIWSSPPAESEELIHHLAKVMMNPTDVRYTPCMMQPPYVDTGLYRHSVSSGALVNMTTTC
jgi:hypothetical protein